MKRRKIILDCDPGHDDAMALLLAGASPELELLGITTVAGNSYVNNTTRNALILTEMAALDVPVAQGASRPLVRHQIVAPNIHGESGLEGANLPAPTRLPLEMDAVRFIAQRVKEFPGEVTLVPVGPLTNIALFLIEYPNLAPQVQEIVLMGGGIAFGNTTPVAEFNIFADPEAADVVFKSGIPITVFGLDLTHQAKIFMPEIKILQQYSSSVVSKMGLLLEFFHQTYFDVFHIEGAPLHDPCAVAYLIAPELYTYASFHTQIELHGNLTYGQTVVDYWHLSATPPNARWALTVDREKYIALIYERMKNYR
ncbi:MAG TPA: nucleoside hydrolase [Thermotogota bacterium]|nr:nucleoside hydrolase [Thermotogota bacterium]